MIRLSRRRAIGASLLMVPALGSQFFATGSLAAGDLAATEIKQIVTEAVQPVMDQYKIPGMAVAVTRRGGHRFFNYGIASKESGNKVTERTIFEIGSVSKTFTATLAALAEVRGKLSLSDEASNYLPALAGSRFDRINLLDLGTYTAGGLPLQFPDDVTDEEKMTAYFRAWRPGYASGTRRVYSNPSIGLFGYLAARSMGRPFDDLMEQEVFPALGLSSTFIKVPADRMGDYAYGYSKDGSAVRVSPGVFDSEAYGVKTTTADMLCFLKANMGVAELDDTLERAIAATHTGYYKIGPMTQGLGWEMYDHPAALDTLLAGNSSDMALKPNKAVKLLPPNAPREDVLINKTGSTNGFGAYVAFIPAKRLGVVILANRNYPIPERVRIAYRILEEMEGTR